MNCHHLQPQRLDLPPPDLETVEIRYIPNLGEKARSWPPQRVIEIDRDFWIGLDTSQRAALVAHEMAHLEPGPARKDDGSAPCESCADKRAGAIMAAWGYSLPQTMKASQIIISTRPKAPYSYGDGWRTYRRRRGPNK